MTRGQCKLGQCVTSGKSATVYVGESTDDLSVYAAPGWGAWLAMWSLIGEWHRG